MILMRTMTNQITRILKSRTTEVTWSKRCSIRMVQLNSGSNHNPLLIQAHQVVPYLQAFKRFLMRRKNNWIRPWSITTKNWQSWMLRKYKQRRRKRNWNLNRENSNNRKRSKENSLIRQRKKKWKRSDNKRRSLNRDKRTSQWLITRAKEIVKRLKAWESSLPKQEKKRCKRRSTRRHRLIGWRDKSVIWGKRIQNSETK